MHSLTHPVVLFLDFDGVLNGDRFLRQQRNHPVMPGPSMRIFDPANLAALDQLCERAPVNRIVVTSTWRIGRSLEQLRAMLADEGFSYAARIVDVTPDLGAGLRSRAAEIQRWIAGQGPLRALILDDCDIGMREGFVQVDGSSGLTLARVDELLAAW